jgi:hypothetical protein
MSSNVIIQDGDREERARITKRTEIKVKSSMLVDAALQQRPTASY